MMNKGYSKPQICIYRLSAGKLLEESQLGKQTGTGSGYSKSTGGIDWDQFDDEEEK